MSTIEQSSDPMDALAIAECRKTLQAYHADTIAVINSFGVEGTSYATVWLEINARFNHDLEAKGKSDAALYALGEFLERIEGAQETLEQGQLSLALMECLVMVRLAHRLRGQMILRDDTNTKQLANKKSIEARAARAGKRKQKIIAFRAENPALNKSECWEKYKMLHPSSAMKRTQFFEHLKGVG